MPLLAGLKMDPFGELEGWRVAVEEEVPVDDLPWRLYCSEGPHTRTVLSSEAETSTWGQNRSLTLLLGTLGECFKT